MTTDHASLFPQTVLDALAAEPGRVAFEHGDRQVTGGELLATVAGIVDGLRFAGLAPGRVVALSTALTPEGFAANLAVHALGCTVLALRPAWSAEQLAGALAGGVDAIVGDRSTLTSELVSFAPGPAVVLSVGAWGGATDLLAGRPAAARGGARARRPIAVEAQPDDIARVNFTSGSTGAPKGCVRTYRTFSRAHRPDGWGPEVGALMAAIDRFLVHGDFSMPIMLTFAARCLATGGSVVIGDGGPRPDLAGAIERYRAAAVAMPPPFLHRLLQVVGDEERDLASLRALVVTGSTAGPDLLAAAADQLGPVVWQGYGQAESGMISLLTPHDIERFGDDAVASVGRVVSDVELAVRHDSGHALPTGERGQIWVRGPHVMAAYWRDEQQTAEVLRDGWLDTRDIGVVDLETGLLHLTGRSRDVIMVNAEVCYAGAIERVLARQPGVRAAYAVGVPDQRTGEAVHAFVVPSGSGQLDTAALAASVARSLSANHVPATITVVPEVPLAASGKPDKRALADRAGRAGPAPNGGIVRYRSFAADNARWEAFAFRPGDIVISTPPKCGTTWTQMLCALLIFGGPEFPAPLEHLSPWLDQQTRRVDEVFATLATQRHRRFVKTHTPLDGLPRHDEVTYIVVGRDPRDVAVSLERHFANMDFDRLGELRAAAAGLDDLAFLPARVPPAADPRERFLAFVERVDRGGPANLATVLHHLRTGWERRTDANVGLFHYADYRTDLVGELLRLAGVLDISLTRAAAEVLAPHAALDRMRARLADVVPNASDGIWKDPAAFLRAGSSGEWRSRASDEDMRRYHERVSSLVPPDLAAWAHLGRLRSGVEPGTTATASADPSDSVDRGGFPPPSRP